MACTELPRLLLAAPASGCGKTTVTCGLLRLLDRRGERPAARKCGPDFIDPMFHRRVLGIPTGNLDLFFTGEADVCRLLAAETGGAGILLIEGVMGYYDGLGGTTDRASSYHLARATGTPVLLVVDAGGASRTVAAVIEGIARFVPDAGIAAVFLNRCSPSVHALLAPLIASRCGLPVVGYLPDDPTLQIGSRHLGLLTPDELPRVEELIDRLADRLAETVDLPLLLRIARSAPPIAWEPDAIQPVTGRRPRLAVAEDRVFCFCYRENLDLLSRMGAEIVPFSPLTDRSLPDGIEGLYLCGGYPELAAEALEANRSMRRSIADAVEGGIPLWAECGGFLYLQQRLADEGGRTFAMAGVLPGESTRGKRLRHFGYIELQAGRDTLLLAKGERVPAHEFHYWQSTDEGDACIARKPVGGRRWPAVVGHARLFAGFPHLYLPAKPAMAARLVGKMCERSTVG